jgi:hypothetical protein
VEITHRRIRPSRANRRYRASSQSAAIATGHSNRLQQQVTATGYSNEEFWGSEVP